MQATDRLAMIQMLGRLIQQVITTITLSVSIIYFSPWLLLLLIAGVVPAFVGESHFAFLGYAKNFRQTPVRRKLDYLRVLGGSKEAAKELKLFGLSKFLTDRFTRAFRRGLRGECRAVQAQAGRGRVAVDHRLAGLLLGLCLRDLADGDGRAHHRLAVFSGGRDSAGQHATSSMIFSTLSGVADQALFLTDLLAFFEMQPTIRSKPNALPAPRPIRRGFEFRNVSFAYPGSERRILKNLDFTLHAGERVALIGENGQGKTTIVKLITRLYDPTEGQILLDGVDLREYSLEDLYREIGVIFQDFMRYEMTARENIAVGRIEELDNTERDRGRRA